MNKKLKDLLWVLLVIACFVVISLLIIFTGTTTGGLNYISLEINPRVEFIVKENNIVKSVNPINTQAKELLSNENFVGKNITTACTDFIELCIKANYINVESTENALNITIVDGLTNVMDVQIISEISKYLRKNEINCVIMENIDDLALFKESKSKNVGNANTYKLIKTINELHPELSIDKLKTKSQKELIEMVDNFHQNNPYKITENDIANKVKLIDFNRTRYEQHLSKINNSSQKEFNTNWEDYQVYNEKNYKLNWNKQYEKWQNTL